MKRKSIVFALALSIGLFATSCSSDDNEGETLAPLEGKWEIVQTGIVGSNGQELLIDAPQNTSGCERDYLNLKIDNTATEGDYSSAVSACALTTKSGIYSRSHNNLTVVIDGITTTSDIVNLTLKELKLKDANGLISVYHK
jgi:hypothetical protein